MNGEARKLRFLAAMSLQGRVGHGAGCCHSASFPRDKEIERMAETTTAARLVRDVFVRGSARGLAQEIDLRDLRLRLSAEIVIQTRRV